jgi:hypothetical protein
VGPAFWFNAATFAASVVTAGRAPPGPRPAPLAAGSWARRIRDGARLMAGDRLLRLLAAVQLLAALSAGATKALLVVLAERRLGTGPGGLAPHHGPSSGG